MALYAPLTRNVDARARVDWVDLSKGLTIMLVVIMHSIDGVERFLDAEGWMHSVLTYATPFRMPVFFAVAGLFAGKAIAKDWRAFFDRKFAHFGYFYGVWMTIEFIFKTPFFIQQFGGNETALYYVSSFVQPFGPLWFIYLLPIYFVVLRLTQRVPMLAQLALAVLLKVADLHTGWFVIDFFAKYYVFFLVGHFARDLWFSLAASARQHGMGAVSGLAVWAAGNGAVVYYGYDALMPVAIIMGILGFMAVIAFMAILPTFALGRGIAGIFRYCGQRSLPIYLGFFLPMGVTRILVLKFGNGDPGLSAFIVAFAAVSGAILMYEAVMRLKIGTFLYVRPQWAKLRQNKDVLVPAE